MTPEHPKQSHIPANCFVKLSPLPHGVTQDDIRTWLEKQALRMRPVRSLAANTWLLAASDHVEACHYLWGKLTVLIAPVASRAPSKPTVLAGGTKPRPLPPISTSASSSHTNTPQDTWDPWSLWHPVLEDSSTNGHSSESSNRYRTWSSKTSQSSHASTLATTSQASEIAAIQVQIKDLTQATKSNQDNEKKLRQDMQQEFSRVRTEVRTQIEASEQSVRSTLDQRIHCIERSLQETNTGMKEGFNAILAKLNHSGPDEPSKRSKSASDMQVEPSS